MSSTQFEPAVAHDPQSSLMQSQFDSEALTILLPTCLVLIAENVSSTVVSQVVFESGQQ